jgi:lincosamide nucleotidyltransferase A/C/D/E
MDAEEVVRVLDAASADGITLWLDGGWGVDALIGRQLREHDDLDVVVELADAPRLVDVLETIGYALVAGAAPKSFVHVDELGRQVDVHPVVFDDARGGGVYLMDAGEEWVYPAAGFEGFGRVAGQDVRCLSAEVQVLVHDGYELTDRDFRELFLLHDAFGVDLPAKYVEQAFVAGEQ